MQILRLGTELEQLQAQVEGSEQRVGEVRREAEEREKEAQQEATRDREKVTGENKRLVDVISKQELELKKCQKRLSELQVEKEKLQVTMCGRDDTISSLHLQVRITCTVEMSLCMYLLSPQLAQLQDSVAESGTKVESLEAVLAKKQERSQHLEEELTAAEEKQLALEQSRSVLESVGAERLALITSLQSEVEGGRVREVQMGEMREKLATLEQLLCSLQDEVRVDCMMNSCV